MRKTLHAREIALTLGIQGLKPSTRKGKRFMVPGPDGWIHFGVWPIRDGTFLDHRDQKKRAAWRARHSRIMRNGKPAYLDRSSPAFYAWHILW